MRKKIKSFLIFALILVIIFLPIQVNALSAGDFGMTQASQIENSPNSVTKGLRYAFSMVRYVGTGVSVIVVLMLGIKYMISSIEDKAEIKKRAVPIVIGCVILFATTNLLIIIENIVTNI